MGEKIKDLRKIKIGNTNFEIELNHGYTNKDKYSIHIQNNTFRYALSDKDYLSLCGLIIRAKEEMDYAKRNGDEKNES